MVDQSSTTKAPDFRVHSTYRHATTGKQLYPRGLQWGLGGTSHLAYYYEGGDDDDKTTTNNDSSIPHDLLQAPATRRALVAAHNQWAFAKQYPFQREQDIVKVEPLGQHHVSVTWKNTQADGQVEWKHAKEDGRPRNEKLYISPDLPTLLQQDPAAQQEDNETAAQVWVNGKYVALLNGPDSVEPVLQAVAEQTKRTHRLSLIRADGLIRIERKFRGYLMNRNIVFAHVWDNLLAMEDVQFVPESNNNHHHQFEQVDPDSRPVGPAVIGTATLPDWIMGGRLTSRVWIQELANGNICFERPLHNDNIATSDRTFELHKDVLDDSEMIDMVKPELDRLRKLASTEHPYVKEQEEREALASKENATVGVGRGQKEDPALEQRRQQHRMNSRKKFGL